MCFFLIYAILLSPIFIMLHYASCLTRTRRLWLDDTVFLLVSVPSLCVPVPVFLCVPLCHGLSLLLFLTSNPAHIHLLYRTLYTQLLCSSQALCEIVSSANVCLSTGWQPYRRR